MKKVYYIMLGMAVIAGAISLIWADAFTDFFKETAKKAEKGIKKAGKEIKKGVEKGAKEVKKGVEKGAKETEKIVKKGAEEIKKGVEKGAKVVGEKFEEVGEKLEEFGKDTKDFFQDLGKKIKECLEVVGAGTEYAGSVAALETAEKSIELSAQGLVVLADIITKGIDIQQFEFDFTLADLAKGKLPRVAIIKAHVAGKNVVLKDLQFDFQDIPGSVKKILGQLIKAAIG